MELQDKMILALHDENLPFRTRITDCRGQSGQSNINVPISQKDPGSYTATLETGTRLNMDEVRGTELRYSY